MIVINYNTAFKALNNYIKTYNEHTEDLSLQVRQSVSATAKELIRIYGVSLAKANGVQKVDPENLPSLKTNNVQLAKLSNSSTRTVQRHIKKLQEAKVITKKVWHGTNSSYELWINPKILLVKHRESQKATKRKLAEIIEKVAFLAEEGPLKEYEKTKCPYTESGDTGNRNNIIIEVRNSLGSSQETDESGQPVTYRNIPCDRGKRREQKLTNENNDAGDTRNPFSGHTGEKVAKNSEDAGEKGRELRAENEKRELKAPDDSARAASLNLYVNMLWILAKNVLYKDVFLTDQQESIAKNLLRKWYEPVPKHNLSRIHEIYIERIGLARKFVQKDPENRFIQLPNRYFDPDNPNGFTGTKKWWKSQEQRKQEVQVKLILHAQIRRYLNNEKKDTAKRRPSLAMYRDCEQRIGKLGNPMLLEQFHSAILKPHSRHHLYKN